MVITFLLLPKNQAEPVKHLGQFWISTYPLSGSVFGQRQHSDSSSDNEFAQQATSSLLERVSQNTIAAADVNLNAEEEADEPYELVIRFKSRPSTDATHAIVEALTSVFSKLRVEAEILTKETEAI